jgi:hypothetical protein
MVVLTLAFLTLMVLYFVAFSELGMGATFYKYMARETPIGTISWVGGVVILTVGYVVDLRTWDRPYRVVKGVAIGLMVLCAGGIAASIFKEFPYAPLLVYFLTCVLVCAAVYQITLGVADAPQDFMLRVGWVSLLSGVCALVTCIIWSSVSDFWWGAATKVEFRNRLRVCTTTTMCSSYGGGVSCRAGCEEIPENSACDPAAEHCLAAMLLFSGGYIISVFNIMVGASLLFVVGGARPTAKATFFSIAGVFVSFLWIAASLNGASTNLANVLVAFSIAGIFILLVCKICLVSIETVHTNLVEIFDNDWGRAGACFILLWLTPVISVLSALNEQVRVHVYGDESHDQRWWTHEIEQVAKKMFTWEWTSVLKKSIGLAFGYIGIVVGVGKITTLFLAWLNIQLSESGMDVWSVSAVIFAVGIMLQFIPVVPGIPIYLACGVTIVPAAEIAFGGFHAACAWASFVAITCKLCGVALVQVTLGGLGRSSPQVRSLVGINTDPIRAFRLVGEKKVWFSTDLTTILIGGPDWPVAVMAGILDLNVLRMILGTLPVSVPVVTTVIAGGYLSKTGDEFQTLASVFSAISAVLFAMMTAAFIRVMRTLRDDPLMNKKSRNGVSVGMPIDEVVDKLDQKAKSKADLADKFVEWKTLSYTAKVVLVSSALTAWVGTVIAAFAADDCFNDVTLTSDYREAPIHSNFGNLLKYPMGTLSASLFVVSLGLYCLFRAVSALRYTCR